MIYGQLNKYNTTYYIFNTTYVDEFDMSDQIMQQMFLRCMHLSGSTNTSKAFATKFNLFDVLPNQIGTFTIDLIWR